MERSFPFVVLNLLRKAGILAEIKGLPLWLVGGSVRDLLLETPPKDLDIAVEGDALLFAPVLADEIGGKLIAKSQFGTARLQFEEWSLDLTSVRSETYEHPGALPQIKPSQIYGDLARRDFTINTMAISLGSKDFGNLVDPFGGQADLSEECIRVLHLASFIDDATRILRAIRYEVRLGFHMDTDTERLAREGVSYLNTISSDRLRRELELAFKEPRPSAFLSRSQGLGVLENIFPSLDWSDRTQETLERWLAYPQFDEPDLYIALLVGLLSIEEKKTLTERLNLTTRWRQISDDSIKVEERFPELRSQNIQPSEIFRLLQGLQPAAIKAWLILTQDERTQQHLFTYWRDYRAKKPWLTGDDLVALGIPRGPRIGLLLAALNAARLDGLIETIDEERDWVRRSKETC